MIFKNASTLSSVVNAFAEKNGFWVDYATDFGGSESTGHDDLLVLVADTWEAGELLERLTAGSSDSGYFGEDDSVKVEIVFADEFSVVGSKAWRTKPDSWHWVPEIWYNGAGDYVTADDDILDIVDALNSERDFAFADFICLKGLPKSIADKVIPFMTEISATHEIVGSGNPNPDSGTYFISDSNGIIHKFEIWS